MAGADWDPYKILGLTPDATNEQIRSSARRLIKHWHPDNNPNDRERAEAETQRVVDARNYLLDADKRKEFDRQAKLRRGGSAGDARAQAPKPNAPPTPEPNPTFLDLGSVKQGESGEELFTDIHVAGDAWPKVIRFEPDGDGDLWEKRPHNPDDLPDTAILRLGVKAKIPSDASPGRHTDSIRIFFGPAVATVKLNVTVVAVPAGRSSPPNRSAAPDTGTRRRVPPPVASSSAPHYIPRRNRAGWIGAAVLAVVVVIIVLANRGGSGTDQNSSSDAGPTRPARPTVSAQCQKVAVVAAAKPPRAASRPTVEIPNGQPVYAKPTPNSCVTGYAYPSRQNHHGEYSVLCLATGPAMADGVSSVPDNIWLRLDQPVGFIPLASGTISYWPSVAAGPVAGDNLVFDCKTGKSLSGVNFTTSVHVRPSRKSRTVGRIYYHNDFNMQSVIVMCKKRSDSGGGPAIWDRLAYPRGFVPSSAVSDASAVHPCS